MRCLGPEDELAFGVLHAYARGCRKQSPDNVQARERSRRALQFSLRSGCDIKNKSSPQNNLLQIALEGGRQPQQSVDISTIELLLENGVDPSAMDERGLQPIHTINIPGPVVCALVRHGADVNARTRGSCKTPLHCCFESYQNEQLQALVDCGADCNAQDKDGDTPLHMALRESISSDVHKIEILKTVLTQEP